MRVWAWVAVILCGCGAVEAPSAVMFEEKRCAPTTCEETGKTCGWISDGCGGALMCGACGTGMTCGPSNTCEAVVPGKCEPRTCESAGFVCGTLDDGCGGTLACGSCADGMSCIAGVCEDLHPWTDAAWVQTFSTPGASSDAGGLRWSDAQLGSAMFVSGPAEAGWRALSLDPATGKLLSNAPAEPAANPNVPDGLDLLASDAARGLLFAGTSGLGNARFALADAAGNVRWRSVLGPMREAGISLSASALFPAGVPTVSLLVDDGFIADGQRYELQGAALVSFDPSTGAVSRTVSLGSGVHVTGLMPLEDRLAIAVQLMPGATWRWGDATFTADDRSPKHVIAWMDSEGAPAGAFEVGTGGYVRALQLHGRELFLLRSDETMTACGATRLDRFDAEGTLRRSWTVSLARCEPGSELLSTVSMAIDADGAPFLAGAFRGSFFAAGAFHTTANGAYTDAFIARLKP